MEPGEKNTRHFYVYKGNFNNEYSHAPKLHLNVGLRSEVEEFRVERPEHASILNHNNVHVGFHSNISHKHTFYDVEMKYDYHQTRCIHIIICSEERNCLVYIVQL